MCVFCFATSRTFAAVSSLAKLKQSKTILIYSLSTPTFRDCCSASDPFKLTFSQDLPLQISSSSSSSSLLLLVLKSVGSSGSSLVRSCSSSTSGLTLRSAELQGFHCDDPLGDATNSSEGQAGWFAEACVADSSLRLRAFLLITTSVTSLGLCRGLRSSWFCLTRTLARGGIGLGGGSLRLRGTVATQKSPTWSCLQSSINLTNIFLSQRCQRKRTNNCKQWTFSGKNMPKRKKYGIYGIICYLNLVSGGLTEAQPWLTTKKGNSWEQSKSGMIWPKTNVLRMCKLWNDKIKRASKISEGSIDDRPARKRFWTQRAGHRPRTQYWPCLLPAIIELLKRYWQILTNIDNIDPAGCLQPRTIYKPWRISTNIDKYFSCNQNIDMFQMKL